MTISTRPSISRPRQSYLQGEAGELAVYDWALPAGPPLGTVLVVHGLGEHAGRYAEVAAHLHQWGLRCVPTTSKATGNRKVHAATCGTPAVCKPICAG